MKVKFPQLLAIAAAAAAALLAAALFASVSEKKDESGSRSEVEAAPQVKDDGEEDSAADTTIPLGNAASQLSGRDRKSNRPIAKSMDVRPASRLEGASPLDPDVAASHLTGRDRFGRKLNRPTTKSLDIRPESKPDTIFEDTGLIISPPVAVTPQSQHEDAPTHDFASNFSERDRFGRKLNRPPAKSMDSRPQSHHQEGRAENPRAENLSGRDRFGRKISRSTDMNPSSENS